MHEPTSAIRSVDRIRNRQSHSELNSDRQRQEKILSLSKPIISFCREESNAGHLNFSTANISRYWHNGPLPPYFQRDMLVYRPAASGLISELGIS